MSFQFAHISDLHLPPLPAVGLKQMLNKRFLGYLSWHKKRKHRHRPEVVAALESLLAERDADHICITGDITNLGLAGEFRAAGRWLDGVARPETVSFVPGNHDAYVRAGVEAMREHFGRWLPDDYPALTRRGDVLFIGISSAVPTAPLLATGHLGSAQLTALESILHRARGQNLFRVLLIHHPPLPGIVDRRKALTDSAPLARVLRVSGVDLILHGHGHRAGRYELNPGDGPIPVFGAGSATVSHRDLRRTGHLHFFELEERALNVVHYHYRPETGRFEPTADIPIPREPG